MLVRGAQVNALAFSGSNYLFIIFRSSRVDEERKRHDKAVEQLQAAHIMVPEADRAPGLYQRGTSSARPCRRNLQRRRRGNEGICPGHRAQLRRPGARDPALRLLSPEWRPERPRDYLRDPGDGRDRLFGLPTR